MSATSGPAALAAKLKQKVQEAETPVRPPMETVKGRQAQGVPAGTVGGVQDSPAFRWTKAIAYQLGYVTADQAKHEIEACGQFRKSLEEANYLPDTVKPRSLMVPLGGDLLDDTVRGHAGYRVMKAMMDAGQAGYDPDEAQWLAARVRKAQSFLIDSTGGTLVPPPVQGDLIELMRPQLACLNAGATQVPLPPNGKISYPRQTGPSTMYWVGENTSITESSVTTGQVNLSAKKGGVFLTVPNELLKYASVAADALLKSDASKTLALGFDYAALYGSGSAFQPKGLVNYTGTNQLIDYAGLTPAPKGVGTDGNRLRPEDGYRMVGLIEDRNFEFTGWVFRPTMANNIMGYRADAVTAADAAGQFVQGMMRAVGDAFPGTNWCGYPVSKSSVVRNNQVKGSSGATLTEVFGGAWNHLLLGMYGAVELASSDTAGTHFQADQTAVRALMFCDAVPRYESAFIYYKQLLNSVN